MKRLKFYFYDWNEFNNYLDSLPRKDAVKLSTIISNIEEQGLIIAKQQKWVKKLEPNLFEIRSKYASNIQRAIYFHWENNKYVITHGFTKKTRKTPKREIKKGLHKRDIYERRHHYE